MSLPTSEPLPANINDLPPARQRHIRRQPRAASPAERGILLDSLLDLSSPTLNYFLLSILGALVFGLTLYFNEPVALFLGLVLMPYFKPVFGLALFPHSHKFSHWIKSLVSLLFPIILTFLVGVLAGYFQKTGQLNRLDAIRFSQLYWLDLAAVVLSTFFCVFILIRQGKLPRKIGVILTYEILFPIAVAGFGFPLGIAQIWPDTLLVAFSHLLLTIFIAILSFLILGFGPKGLTGWIFALLPFILSLTLLAMALKPWNLTLPLNSQITPTIMAINTGTNTASMDPVTSTPEINPSPTGTAAIQTKTNTLTITPSATETPSPTDTSTPQPTTFIISIDSTRGMVIREAPDFQSIVISYANDDDQLTVLNQAFSENGSLWYQVRTSEGDLGWLLGSLANTQTPESTEDN